MIVMIIMILFLWVQLYCYYDSSVRRHWSRVRFMRCIGGTLVRSDIHSTYFHISHISHTPTFSKKRRKIKRFQRSFLLRRWRGYSILESISHI